MIMEGIVTCIKYGPNASFYYVAITGPQKIELIELKSRQNMSLGEIINTDSMGIRNGKESRYYKNLLESRIDTLLDEAICSKPYSAGIKGIDEATARMWIKLCDASRLFLKKILTGAPIVVRFHNDADGSTGACCIYNGVLEFAKGNRTSIEKQNIIWMMHKGVLYSEFDAESDILIINNFSSIERPLLVLIDFGTSEGSNKGLERAKSVFDMIWLDHHPISGEFLGTALRHYINPWLHGSGSGYTAGFLASAFSKTFSEADNRDLENASLIGDYSEYADLSIRGKEVSAVLDLITSDVRTLGKTLTDNITPAEIYTILNSKAKFNEMLAYASMRMTETLDLAIRSVRVYQTEGANIHLSDFESSRNAESKYPLPGRFSSKLLDRVQELSGKPCIVVLHKGVYVSIRIGKKISDRIDIHGIIKNLAESYPDDIESGGGHANAASIKLTNEENKKKILRDLINMLKESSNRHVAAK